MYLGQPLITTGTSALRSYFYKGAVFVEHSALDIKLKTEMGLRIENELRSEMVKLRSEKIEEWVVSKEILLSDFT